MNPHQSSTGFEFIIQGDGNSSFNVQQSMDLATWSSIATLTDSAAQVSFTDTNNTGAYQFYRARLLP
jgi:hypothetical protein